MKSVERCKKGDFVWKIKHLNWDHTTFKPAIFVRYVTEDKALLDVVDASGRLNREFAPLGSFTISTSEPSQIKLKNKELKTAIDQARFLIKKKTQTLCHVRLEHLPVSVCRIAARMKNIAEKNVMFLKQLKKSAKACSNSVKSKVNKKPVFKCNICGESFVFVQWIKIHMHTKHPGYSYKLTC